MADQVPHEIIHHRIRPAPFRHLDDDEDAGSGRPAALTDNLRTADEDNPKAYYEFGAREAAAQGRTRRGCLTRRAKP